MRHQTWSKPAREIKEKEKKKGQERKTSLAEFFAASPLRGSGLRLKRLPSRLRKINLGKTKKASSGAAPS